MAKSKVGDIPSCLALRKKLGVGTPGDKESIFFRNTIQDFRVQYMSDEGDPGSEFRKWDEHSHQKGLIRMTDDFLEIEGKGPRFWPDDEGSAPVKTLKWTKDRARIKKLIKQLFFRMNQQERWKGSGSKLRATNDRSESVEPRRSQTLDRERPTEQRSIENEDTTMDEMIEYWNQDEDDTDSPGHPWRTSDPYEVPQSPDRASAQGSTTGTQTNETHGTQRPAFNSDSTRANERPPPLGHTAPLAQMTEHQEATPPPEATDPTTNNDTPSGRSRRPVERQGFVDPRDVEMDEDPRSYSPAPSERSDPDFRPSPEPIAQPQQDPPTDEHSNARSVSESEPLEQPRPSTERALPPNIVTSSSTMPPPPLPLPRRTPVPAPARTRRRIVIKYSMQITPGNYRLWDHRGTFDRMSMVDFEKVHKLTNIKSVRFLLEGEDMSWDDQVSQGDNFAFQNMKKRFIKKIRSDLAKPENTREVMEYEILIIPVKGAEPEVEFIREQTVSL
ncbi:hypothetical protein FSARC_10841 [Fusarium sarcochroum]|uniref:Uncharacterized protein n=1 Tax=Fusarium sarcochroum TaxID=1208366 RepID=A0A8H4TJE7_9HYPO|nr:hypothetical protein FSARC_10841 [Fusarium sarcochroum]